MVIDIYIFSTAISLGFLLLILELVRRRSLKEQYSLLWIFVSLIMVILSARHEILEEIAHLLGVYYAPALLFLLGLIFSFALTLHFSLIISKYRSQYVRAVQELSLLNRRVEELEAHLLEKRKPRSKSEGRT